MRSASSRARFWTARPELTELLRFALIGDTVVGHSMTPLANLMLSVMGAFAEFERSLIRESLKEGIALAKQRGAYKGREKTFTPERAAELVQRTGNGVSKALLSRDYGICREIIYQYLRQDKLT